MKVVFSAEAKKQLELLVAYLETEWSVSARDRFLKQLRQSVAVIKKLPNAYPTSERFADARRCVVVPQVSLFYRVDDEVVIILALLDNRMDF